MLLTGGGRDGDYWNVKFGAIVWVGWICVGFGLSACASTTPPALSPQHLASPETDDLPRALSDPNEEFNRSVFETNQKFNHSVLYPVAKTYNAIVPEAVRDRIAAFTTNLSEPMVFANDVVQLRPKAAATTLGRFVFNSTIGLGGLFDVAAAQGLEHQSGDLGQTMYVWGYRDSSYLVLPVVGPTNVRDALGSGIELAAQFQSSVLIPTQILSAKSVVDIAEDIDPITDVANIAGSVTTPLTNLSKAEDMQNLEESSVDFYSMLRSVTDQKRQAELQEALDTSALTSTPPPPDPNAIEPVMTIVSSPTMLEKPKVWRPAGEPGGTIVAIGPPTPVIQH
jgi:phospholipid-binding lipoprotein MlaA